MPILGQQTPPKPPLGDLASYPDERYRVTKARDQMRAVIQEFLDICPSRAPTTDSKDRTHDEDGRLIATRAQTALDNLKHWAKNVERPDEPAKNNEIVACMQLLAGLVRTKQLKDGMQAVIDKALKDHKEFEAAYQDYYYNQVPSSGIQNAMQTRAEMTASGHELTVDYTNKMVLGPKGEGGFDAAVTRAKGDPELIGEFNPSRLIPSPPLERLADTDMTGWAQRKKTTTEIIKLFEANMPPYKDAMTVLPFLNNEQRSAVNKAMNEYNVRAREHAANQAARTAGTQANVTNQAGPGLVGTATPASNTASTNSSPASSTATTPRSRSGSDASSSGSSSPRSTM